MTVTQITYVLHTAKELNISKAAEALFVSQSALSQQLQKLEKELGYRIFERTAHGLRITEEGEWFCTQAQSLLEHWEQFQKTVRTESTVRKRHLHVFMGARVYSNGLFQDVMQFLDEHRDIAVTFVTEAGGDFLAELKENKVDLAVDRLPTEDATEDPAFYTCALVKERQCVLMSRDDPRAARPSIALNELHGSTVISGLENSSEDRMLKTICRTHGFSFGRIFRSDGIETGMNLVRNGKGIALGPKSFSNYYNVAAVELNPPTDVTLRFICLKDEMNREEVRLLCQYLKESCRRRGLLPE